MGRFCTIKSLPVRIFMAEFLGTLLLVILPVAANHQMLYENAVANPIQGALAGGMGAAIGIFIAAKASGGHCNPAVSIAFWVVGRLHKKFLWNTIYLAVYFAAQLSGAFTAALLVRLVYWSAETDEATKQNAATMTCIYATCPTTAYKNNEGVMFFDQVISSAILVMVVRCCVDPRNANPKGLAPLCIGLGIMALGLSFGSNAGGAFNPARDFGPRLFASMFYGSVVFSGTGPQFGQNDAYFFWIPLLAPLCGGVIGSLTYYLLVESHWPEQSSAVDISQIRLEENGAKKQILVQQVAVNPYGEDGDMN